MTLRRSHDFGEHQPLRKSRNRIASRAGRFESDYLLYVSRRPRKRSILPSLCGATPLSRALPSRHSASPEMTCAGSSTRSAKRCEDPELVFFVVATLHRPRRREGQSGRWGPRGAISPRQRTSQRHTSLHRRHEHRQPGGTYGGGETIPSRSEGDDSRRLDRTNGDLIEPASIESEENQSRRKRCGSRSEAPGSRSETRNRHPVPAELRSSVRGLTALAL